MWQRQFLIASVIVCWMSGSTDALGNNLVYVAWCIDLARSVLI